MTIPRLSAQQPIVVAGGKPSSLFLRFMEEARKAQELTDAAQTELLNALQDAVEALQGATQVAQAAQSAANNAQATADAAGGGGTVSGAASNPVIDLPDASWVNGPQVDLTGVVAGDLTLVGSGPQQDDDVSVSVGATADIEWRVVEIDGMTETTVFTGTARARRTTGPATITNFASEELTAFSLARTNTGAISYRTDARATSGSVLSLALYVFARRAA